MKFWVNDDNTTACRNLFTPTGMLGCRAAVEAPSCHIRHPVFVTVCSMPQCQADSTYLIAWLPLAVHIIRPEPFTHCRVPRPSSPGTPPAVCEATPFSETLHPVHVSAPPAASFIMQGKHWPYMLYLQPVSAAQSSNPGCVHMSGHCNISVKVLLVSSEVVRMGVMLP